MFSINLSVIHRPTMKPDNIEQSLTVHVYEHIKICVMFDKL